MKNIIVIIIALFLFSCEDVLVEEPKSIAVEFFYNTAAEVESAIAAIYEPVATPNIFGTTYIAQHEVFSDYSTGRGSYGPLNEYQGLDGTNMTRTEKIWKGFYLSIRNANLVINNVPDGTNISDEEKSKFIAEAKFLRALWYFHLVRNWAGVPIRTEQNMDEIKVPRSTVAEVYQLITDDLDFAEENLPDAAPIAGKPSKWSAKTLLADVYFYQGMNTEASEKANEVIQSGNYSLVNVAEASDFDNLYGATVVSSTEEVFYIKYSIEDIWDYVIFCHGGGTPYLGWNGYYVFHSKLDNPMYVNWDSLDLRKEFAWYEWETGLGLVALYKKFSDPEGLPRNDYPMYRYADLLLIYAEASCAAASQPTADGMEKLNMVHRRAYGYDPLQPSPVDFNIADYDQQSFTELVIKERGFETIAEAKRWLDLKRSGKVEEYILTGTGKDVAEKHLLYPIPIAELNYNTAIDPVADQNPGY